MELFRKDRKMRNFLPTIKSITRKEILQNIQFYDEIPDFGDVMTYKQFMEYVNSGCIIDYDGDGDLMLFGKVVKALPLIFMSEKFFLKVNILYHLKSYIEYLGMI